MNNRYLYRAKRTDNGEWVEGFLANGKWYLSGKEICAILPLDLCFFPHCEISEWIEIDTSTICQCTGLKDKNGKLIWENDIMCGHLDDKFPEDITYTKVLWYDNGFCTQEYYSSDIAPIDDFDKEYFEVCGNIFDNPELLEK